MTGWAWEDEPVRPNRSPEPCCNGEVIVKYRTAADQARARVAWSEDGSRLAEVMRRMGACEVSSLARELPQTSPARAFRYGVASAADDSGLSQISLLRYDTTRVASVEEAVEMLRTLDEVSVAEPNYILSIQPMDFVEEVQPQAARFDEQWGLKAIRMPELWQQPVIHKRQPVVGIVDTGVDPEHPELKGRIAPGGYDIVRDTAIIRDLNGHGTHCAGIIAAAGQQVIGANPDALVLPICVISPQGTGSIYNIMLGILRAVKEGADIVSLSIGGYVSSALYEQVIQTAAKKAIIVAAAGNDGYCMHHEHRDLHGTATPHYPNIPGAYAETIGIMATQEDGQLASWSNFDCDGPLRAVNNRGWGYQLRVPGKNILSTLPDGKYGYMSGTSMATPLAAGAISRLLQCRDFDSRDELVRTLAMTTHGHIDLMEAYQATPETLHPGTFTERIGDLDFTFVETSDSTVQMGDGKSPAIDPATVPALLTIPDEARGLAVTTLAQHALEGCTALQTVKMGRSIIYIRSQAFHGCSALKEIHFDSQYPPVCLPTAFDKKQYMDVTIRNARGFAEAFDSVSPWKDFFHWKDLELTTGSRFRETIDSKGTTMSFIFYDKEHKMLQVGDGELAVDSLFEGSLTIPTTVQEYTVYIIGDNAFKGHKALTAIEMPRTLLHIWDNVFDGCTGLKEVTIPPNVYHVGTRAFAGCTNLHTITLSKAIETIGSFAFVLCPSLSNIYVPCAEPPELKEDAFLTAIIYEGDGFDIKAGDKVYKNARLYVPYGSKARYTTAPGWQLFEHIEETTFDGIADLQMTTATSNTVYDLQGRRAANGTSVRHLTRGLYVINGRKVLLGR